jgi:sugar lactone lactonase YvrE
MRNCINLKAGLTFVLVCVVAGMQAQTLSLKWKTDTVFRVPESTYLDAKNNVLYVANIEGKSDEKDGKGFISKLTPDGKVTTLQWVTGLNAPKGMGVYKSNLYVADLSRIVTIDIASGKPTFTEVDGAQFLNDISVDEKGNIYASESRSGKIYRFAKGKGELYFENADIKSTNGVLVQKDALYFVDFKSGDFYKLDWNKQLTKIGTTATGGDGIVAVGKNEFIISSWYGEVYFMDATGKAFKLLDTKEQKLSSADVGYDEKNKILYVPTFFGNSVMAYSFQK